MKRGFILVLIVTLAGFARAQGEGDEGINYGTSTAASSVHFQGVGYIGLSAIPIPLPTTKLSLGVMKDEHFFFGGGVGLMMYLSRYHDADPTNKTLYALPAPLLYLHTDIYFSRKWGNVAPYFTLSAGCAALYMGYASAGFGVDYRSFVWQLTYSPNCIFGDSDLFHHGVSFNFGYRFNTAKYYKQKKTT